MRPCIVGVIRILSRKIRNATAFSPDMKRISYLALGLACSVAIVLLLLRALQDEPAPPQPAESTPLTTPVAVLGMSLNDARSALEGHIVEEGSEHVVIHTHPALTTVLVVEEKQVRGLYIAPGLREKGTPRPLLLLEPLQSTLALLVNARIDPALLDVRTPNAVETVETTLGEHPTVITLRNNAPVEITVGQPPHHSPFAGSEAEHAYYRLLPSARSGALPLEPPPAKRKLTEDDAPFPRVNVRHHHH